MRTAGSAQWPNWFTSRPKAWQIDTSTRKSIARRLTILPQISWYQIDYRRRPFLGLLRGFFFLAVLADSRLKSDNRRSATFSASPGWCVSDRSTSAFFGRTERLAAAPTSLSLAKTISTTASTMGILSSGSSETRFERFRGRAMIVFEGLAGASRASRRLARSRS